MAGKGDTFENDLLKLIFQATGIANIADNASTSPLTALEIALHTADPTDSGNQSSSEATYGGYVRVSVNRTATGWTVTGNTVYPGANIDFASATSGSNTISHFSVGTATSGTGKILYAGTVTPNISVTTGVTPRLTTGTNITED